jgi:hypothetical protein
MRNFLLTLCLFLIVQVTRSQTSYTWNGSVSTAWNTASNWTPAGVPTAADNITIVTGSNACLLNANATVKNMTLNSGQLNLNSFTLLVNGTTATFNAGTVQNGTLTISGVSTVSFNAGPTNMNCVVNIDAATITIRNTTFQGVTTITKTGSSNDWSSGGNIFNGDVTVNNTGAGYILLGNGNPDQFMAASTFNNTSANNIYVGYNSTNNLFNGPATFNNAPSTNNSILVSSYSTGTVFNSSITVTSVSGAGVYFCNNNSTATATLAAGNTINIGPAGFSTGTLSLRQLVQTGTTPQNIALTGTASLVFGPSSSFGGKVVASAPSLYLNGCLFDRAADFTKTGTNNDNGSGGNTFNGVLTVNNAGSGSLMLGNSNPDLYNDSATFNNTGSNHLYVAHSDSNHIFNGPVAFNNATTAGGIYVSNNSKLTTFNNNIVVTSVSGNGVQFCTGSGLAIARLAVGYTLSIGPAGFSAGTLNLRQFTQSGATAQNISLTGTGRLAFGPSSQFDGDVTAVTPTIFLHGCIFNGITNLTKTGSSGDYSNGGNIFNGVSNITNTGTSFLLLGNTNADIWNNDVVFTNNGSERILPCWNSAGNQFNGDIYINSSDTASGIQFCGGNNTATATLAAGKTILPGVVGLTAGYLYLKQFTQLGNVPLNISGTGTSSVYLGPFSEFNAPVTVTAPDVWVQGAMYHNAASFTKTGGGSNHNNQRLNVFDSTCTINQQSNTGYFMLGYNSDDQFNNDIIVSCTGTGGIYLGRPAGGFPTLAAGRTIQVGPGGYSAGFLSLRTFTQLGTAPLNLNFTGTNTYLSFSDSCTIGGNVFSNTPGIYFHASTFKGKVDATKTGITNDGSIGNNKFMDSLSITNLGSGYIQLGNNMADTFYNAVNLNSSGSSYIGTGWNSAGNLFKGNITVSSSGSSSGINFCNNASASATLEAGNTLQVGSGGFSTGTLYVRRFKQAGNAAISLPLNGTSSLIMGPSAELGGNVTASSPSLYLHGTVFNGTSDLTKTGSSGDYSNGGNVFNGASTITNNGSSFLLLGNTNIDIWNSDVTFTNNGSERILPCWNSTGNQFNGNIYLNANGSATGIRFCGGNNTATAIQAAGKTIQVGSDGFNSGNLIFKQFTQLGNAQVNLTLGSTATYVQFGPLAQMGGNVTTSSPGIFFHGCTFNGKVNTLKTGASFDYSNGGNIFNDSTTMTNAGGGYLLLANGSPDQFITTATFNNTGSSNTYAAHNSTGNVFGGVTTFNNAPTANSGMYVSQNSAGTVFNNNIIVTSTNGQGVQFCGNSAGSATLAGGHTISIGGAGFSAGTLLLRQFTQTGPTTQTLGLNGNSTLVFGPGSAFGGDVTSVSPNVYFNGCNFSGFMTGTKTGANNDASNGNNIFTGVATMTNTGSGYLMFGNGSSDQFMTTATFNNAGTSNIYVAHNSNGNTFNGVTTFNNTPTANTGMYISQSSPNTVFNNNIVVTSTAGQGVQFCTGSAGAATLSASHTITVGAGGFTVGNLLLRQFTQAGTTVQNLSLTGTSNLVLGPTVAFNGDLTTNSPGLFFHGGTYNGVVNSTKTGVNNDQSNGNNTFNGAATFTVNGTGYLMMTNSTGDTYNNDVTFVQVSTGKSYPNYNNNSTYGGNVTVTSPSAAAITFGSGNGTATFNGSGAQTISLTAGTPVPIFAKLAIANTGSGVTLNTPINVSKTLALNSGLLNTTTTNILTMLNNSTTAPGNALSTSYVNGPMRYQKSSTGTTTLNFPVGTAPDCRPVVLTVNHSNNNLYTYQAQLFNASAEALGYSLPPSVDRVSQVHYYTINRMDASFVNQPTLHLSGNQQIQMFFGTNDVVLDGSKITIVKNTNTGLTAWKDIGGASAPAYNAGARLVGSVTSTSAPTTFISFSTFALANSSLGMNLLPVGLLYFEAKPNNDQVDLRWATSMEANNSYYTIEKSRDGLSFSGVQKVKTKAANGNSNTTLNYTGVDQSPYGGVSYYRLKQTDLNGVSRYSRIVTVTFAQKLTVSVYPNPSTGKIYVTGLNVSQSSAAFEWYDVTGKLLAKQMVPVSNGVARLETTLTNGVYLLKFTAADGTMKLQNIVINK